jgi:hypothetical protein
VKLKGELLRVTETECVYRMENGLERTFSRADAFGIQNGNTAKFSAGPAPGVPVGWPAPADEWEFSDADLAKAKTFDRATGGQISDLEKPNRS